MRAALFAVLMTLFVAHEGLSQNKTPVSPGFGMYSARHFSIHKQNWLRLTHEKRNLASLMDEGYFSAQYGEEERMEFYRKSVSLRKAEIATSVVRSLGGPFKNAYFFTSRELLNGGNFILMSQMPRREGIRFPLGKNREAYGSNFSFAIQTERWPSRSHSHRRQRNAISIEIRFVPLSLWEWHRRFFLGK